MADAGVSTEVLIPQSETPGSKRVVSVVSNKEAQETTGFGLIGEWEQAQRALATAREKMDKKGAEVKNSVQSVIKKLDSILPVTSGTQGEEIVRSGTLIGKDGKNLNVTISEGKTYGDLKIDFDDLVDPARRSIQIRFDDITLIGKADDIVLDEFEGYLIREGGVRRTEDGYRSRQQIAKDETYAHLRDDLNRDVLDAAADGLAFILDTGTTLKPVETPTAALQ